MADDVLSVGDEEEPPGRDRRRRRRFGLGRLQLLDALRSRWPRGSRNVGIALVVAVVLGGGVLLRAGTRHLAAPQAGTTAATSTPTVPPVITSDVPFSLLVSDRGRLVRIDRLDGQRTVTADLPATLDGHQPSLATGAWVTADNTVLLVPGPGGKGLVAAVLARGGGPYRRLGPAQRILPGNHGWTAWLVVAGAPGHLTIQEFGLDGRPHGAAFAVPPGTEPVAIAQDTVILSAKYHALSAWRPGREQPVALGITGLVVSTGQELIIVADPCPLTAECPHTIVDISRLTRTRLAVGTVEAGLRPLSEPVLSQDGLWLALTVDPDTSDGKPEVALAYGPVLGHGTDLIVVPGTRSKPPRDTTVTSAAVQPGWSIDGRVFGYPSARGGIFAFQPGEVVASRLDVSGLTPLTRIVAG